MLFEKLTSEEIAMILESLSYTKLKFEDYDKYPSHEYKQQRILEVTNLISKIKSLKKD